MEAGILVPRDRPLPWWQPSWDLLLNLSGEVLMEGLLPMAWSWLEYLGFLVGLL